MPDRQRLAHILIPVVLTLAALALLTVRLSQPDRIIFDETYYVNDAREILARGVEDGFVVHPPTGKLLIAAGIRFVGDDPTGWRIAGAIAGALTVLLTYLIGRRLFRRAGPAALAAVLLVTDGLFFAQARTSMLDIFLAFFIALAAWLLLVDHDRVLAPAVDPVRLYEPDDNRSDPARHRVPARSRWPRYLAGVALGLAVSTKWSGALALLAAGTLSLGWELTWRRRVTGHWLRQAHLAMGGIAVALVLIPGATYVATYIPWMANYAHSYEGVKQCRTPEGDPREPCQVTIPGRFAGLWRSHTAIWRFHSNLEAEHPYRAPAYTWPVMARPVVYYWESCSPARAQGLPRTEDDGTVVEQEPCVVDEGQSAEILAVGNPALWYPFLAAAALLAAGVARRDRRAVFIVAFWGAQFLPWLFVTRPVFFFYSVPNLAFLALGVGYAVTVLDERRRASGVVVGSVVGAMLGMAAGLAGELVLAWSTSVWRWFGLGIGLIAGAAIGGLVDHSRDRRDGGPPARRMGTWVAVAVVVLAALLFVYFFPVWSGIPMDGDAVRQRWWQRGWV